MRKRGDGSWFAGLRAFDDPEAVFELEDCLITAEPVLVAWREVLAAAAHLPEEPRLRGTVRVIDGRAHFVLEGGREWSQISAFLDATAELLGIVMLPSPPALAIDMAHAAFESVIAQMAGDVNDVLIFNTELTSQAPPVYGGIYLLPNAELMQQLFHMLERLMEPLP